MSARAALALLLAGVAGNARAEESAPEAVPADPVAVVERFVAHYNARELDALLALTAEDVVWMTLDQGRVAEDVRGRAALGDWLAGYFRQFPEARSTVEWTRSADGRVVSHECAHYDALDGRPKRQCAVAVYTFTAGRIARVWYLPAPYRP